MSWEAISGVTGIVSAFCTVISLAYLSAEKKTENISSLKRNPILSPHKFMSLLLASSGWALCCLCYLWIEKPYGSYPMADDYLQLYGVILGLPAIAILFAGLSLLIEKEET